MASQPSPSRKQPLFTAPACLVVLGLVCAITTEELLGYQVLSLGERPFSSYVLLCLIQAALAIVLLAAGPHLGSILTRPSLLAGTAAIALAGSALANAGSTDTAGIAPLVGFALLALASFVLKITTLEIFADAPPWKLSALIFCAVLIQPFLAPLFALPNRITWFLAGVTAAIGISLTAAARSILTKRATQHDPGIPPFQHPFTPSLPVLGGVGVICAATSFLNPLSLYDSITTNDFLAFTFLTHFAAALLFGIVIFAGHNSSYAIAFKSVDSLVLIGFFLLALMGAGSLLPRAVCTATFSLFEFITFLAIADLASYSSTNRLRLFGGYYLLMRTSSLIGIALNAGDVAFIPLASGASLFGSMLAAACVIAAIWLITEPHLNQFFWGNPATEIGIAATRPTIQQMLESAPRDASSLSPETPETPEMDLAALIDRSVGQLAIEHGLTPRERDVLALMAQGRSSTFIGEELFVSTNTVRKHIAHVYEKLGVHSKQELLTLVQCESTHITCSQ
ncbi:helix-turn-helix transcriptional regulator [Adlercreutzia sp. R21]|uniref:helix-turn-helix transcriptional regulator n=1 Tax=Adlercreutzia wanghongyangiae TaxID=3111451 RepID=UPI002DB5F2A9|nr:helix-turn-helix transcriptional regulator [Adlercreutzia sp. R21]MEC4184199.1 helix-turn-helix transcriptional regulator [Adlercreutzia sp. R21]